MNKFDQSALVTLDDSQLDAVSGGDGVGSGNSFSLISLLPNGLGLGGLSLGLLGDSSNTTTTTNNNAKPAGLLGLGGLLGIF